MRPALLGSLVLLMSMFAAASVAADSDRIIVTNARMIGRDAPSKDVRVNLLVVGGKPVSRVD